MATKNWHYRKLIESADAVLALALAAKVCRSSGLLDPDQKKLVLRKLARGARAARSLSIEALRDIRFAVNLNNGEVQRAAQSFSPARVRHTESHKDYSYTEPVIAVWPPEQSTNGEAPEYQKPSKLMRAKIEEPRSYVPPAK